MRKFTLLTILALVLQSCATGGFGSRSLAGIGGILDEFIELGLKQTDNLVTKAAKEGLSEAAYIAKKSASTRASILADIKKNPYLYGLDESVDVKAWKSLDDAEGKLAKQDYDKFMADVLSKANKLLKFKSPARVAALKALDDFPALSSKMNFKLMDTSKITWEPKFSTKFGRDFDLRTQAWYNDLADTVGREQADLILKNNLATSKELFIKANKLAKANPSQAKIFRKHASDILEDSMIIESKTGRPFLGAGGCKKLDGVDVHQNWAAITNKTMDDVVESGRKLSDDEVSEMLVKNHEQLLNRTKKEACFSVRELTVGTSCSPVYAKGLAPQC